VEEDIVFNPAGYEKHGKNEAGKPKDSYEAGYSNVSILERMNLKRETPQKEISLYIEGIGTQDNLGDDWKGSGFGKSKTGVKNKVQIGVSRMAANIIEVLASVPADSFVEKMTIDVFGFSRGATAARHFVSLLNAKTPLAAQLGIPQAEIKIKFVGIFDTVSSVGYGIGFGSDVEELGLKLASIPQKVVHLAAANEYRENFSLTDITSSLQAGVGYELVLPGAHSNIGGSYGEVTDEEERELHTYEHEQLIKQGWYRAEEITRTAHPVYDREDRLIHTTYSYAGRRLDLTWEYQFIPLAIMADCAKNHSLDLLDLGPGSPFVKYSLPADHPLVHVQQVIKAQVAVHSEQGRHVLRFQHDPSLPFEAPAPAVVTLPLRYDLVQLVRNRYLHRSASKGFQGLDDGRERIGMGERRKDGQPHRLVFIG
jgi:hypothetical protein